MPLYILFGIYSVFDYTAAVAARRMHLPWWAEAPAAGLFTVLLDMPYDIMGVKLLWWTWHDTDPNVNEKTYSVPWTSYYFHAAFACSFNLLLKAARNLLLPKDYDWKLAPREILAIFIAAGGAFWLGAIQFVPIYHFFHDFLGVPTENCVFIFLFMYAYIVWIADRNAPSSARPRKMRLWLDELALVVSCHFLHFMAQVVFFDDPTIIRAVGLHEPLGPCNNYTNVQTISGMVLKKRSFLCASDYDEPYFDFRCLEGRNPPRLPDGGKGRLDWYTICGTPYPNHAEYIVIVWASCIFGAAVLYQALGRSGETPVAAVKSYSPRKKKRE